MEILFSPKTEGVNSNIEINDVCNAREIEDEFLGLIHKGYDESLDSVHDLSQDVKFSQDKRIF